MPSKTHQGQQGAGRASWAQQSRKSKGGGSVQAVDGRGPSYSATTSPTGRTARALTLTSGIRHLLHA